MFSDMQQQESEIFYAPLWQCDMSVFRQNLDQTSSIA